MMLATNVMLHGPTMLRLAISLCLLPAVPITHSQAVITGSVVECEPGGR